MPEQPTTGDSVLDLVRKSDLVGEDALADYLNRNTVPPTASDTATMLVEGGILTSFQARLILQGRYKGFRLGPYKILDQLGSGGMGQVFLAEHIAMRRRVALKVLPTKQASDRANVERFYREARAVAALDHPNIVRAHDVCQDKGAHFIVMEFAEGKNLSDVLKERGAALPFGVAAGYVVQVAAGLQHAHSKGVVHRDIKPANLIVDKDGVIKILDMGLARFFEDEDDKLTQRFESGAVMGTADYVAPEQLIDSSGVDHRADIYSLGATLYHLVTGQTPFTGTTTAKLVAHQLRTAAPAHAIREDIPAEMSAVIGRMMAKDPADRYATAYEVMQALLPFVADPQFGPGASGRLPPLALAGVSQSSGNLTTALAQAQQTAAMQASRSTDAIKAETTAKFTASVKSPAAEMEGIKPRSSRRVVLAVIGLGVLAAGGATAWLVMGSKTEPRGDTAAQVPSEGKQNRHPTPPPPTATTNAVPTSPPIPQEPAPAKLTLAFALPVDPKGGTEMLLFTPDGSQIVSSGADKKIRVWNAANGTLVRQIEAHANNIRGLALMPNARHVLSSSTDKTIRLTDLETGTLIRKYEGQETSIMSVAPLPNGRSFLSTGINGSVFLWDTDSGEVRHRITFGKFPVYDVVPLGDGRRAVAADFDPKRVSPSAKPDPKASPMMIRVFSLVDGTVIREHPIPAAAAHMALSPDGRTVAVGTFDGVLLWDVETGWTRMFAGLIPLKDKSGARVLGVAFTPDGRYVLATGYSQTFAAWEVATGKLAFNEPVATKGGLTVRVSPDGRLAAVGGQTGLASIWKLPAGVAPSPPSPLPPGVPAVFTLLQPLAIPGAQGPARAPSGRPQPPDPRSVDPLAYSSNGKHLISGSQTGEVRVWDADTGAVLKTLTGHKSSVRRIATLPDGRRFLTASSDKTVRLWDPAVEPPLVRTFEGYTVGVNALVVMPDGRRFLAAASDGNVWLWDLETTTPLLKLPKQHTSVQAMAVSPDGKKVIVGLFDNKRVNKSKPAADGPRPSSSPPLYLAELDIEANRELRRVPTELSIFYLVLSADGTRATFGTGEGIGVWDLVTNQVQVADGAGSRVNGVTFTADERHVLTTHVDGRLVAWDAASAQPVSSVLTTLTGLLTLSPDGKRVAIGGSRGGAVWALPAGILPGTIAPTPELSVVRALTGFAAGVEDVAFTPDGSCVVASGSDKTIRLWNASTGEQVGKIAAPTPLRSLALLPDGRRILSASQTDPAVRLWDLSTGEMLKTFEGHDKGVLVVALLPDGRRFLTGGNAQPVRLWDLETGQELRRYSIGTGYHGLAALADGTTFVVSCLDKTVRAWDLDKGAEVGRGSVATTAWWVAASPVGRAVAFGGDGKGQVWDLAASGPRKLAEPATGIGGLSFSRDGKLLYGGGNDRSFHVWDAVTGTALAASRSEYANTIRGVALSPDGRLAATAGTDGLVLLWKLPREKK